MAERDRDTENRIAIDAGARRRWSLLAMGEHGVFTFPLPETGEITIGRAEICDVAIGDGELSREHARLVLGARVEIVDLGSSNGTRVGGELLVPHTPRPLAPGDVTSVGRTILVLQPATAQRRPRQLWSHGYFESRLEEECARAAQRKKTFAVLRVRFEGAATGSALESRLSTSLGPDRVVGSYAPGEYEVLLTDVSPEEADREARALASLFASPGPAPEIGVACYPRDGRTPEALVSRAGKRRRRESPSPDLPVIGALARLHPIAERFAAGTIPILVLGETGVGKDVLAAMIHRLSPRASQPYVCLNCAALPEQLFESELFGYERGAFTGATTAKAGLLEMASGGTVFLDEIGEMPLSVQAKLLRVLDQGEVLRLGAMRPRPINVRFVTATNRDLEAEVAAGRFREDLFFRLVAASIVIPPLRERVEEIASLAVTFAAQAARELGRGRAPQILPNAMELLERHAWPGNVRELRNEMERAVLLADGGDIGVEHLAQEQMGRKLRGAGYERPPDSSQRLGMVGSRGAFTSSQTMQAPAYDPRAETLSPEERGSLPPLHIEARVTQALVRDPEAAIVLAVLDACGWNQTKAAAELGVSRRTLVTRLSAYGLTRKRAHKKE